MEVVTEHISIIMKLLNGSISQAEQQLSSAETQAALQQQARYSSTLHCGHNS